MARSSNSRFRQGRGVFTCGVCKRQTRDAGQALSSDCCPECFELAGLQNSVFDGIDVAEVAQERDRLLAKAVKQGSAEALIRHEFPELWPATAQDAA